MQTGACRILGDMHDLATFARHMCRVCHAQTTNTQDNYQPSLPSTECTAKVRDKWRGIQQRHQDIANGASGGEVVSQRVLCDKMHNGAALCMYCNHYKASGLDRIDSSQGYTNTNTVPCCTLCNFAKANFSQDVFLQKSCMICRQWSQELKTHKP